MNFGEADEMTILNLLALVRDKSVSAINKADKAQAAMDAITNGRRRR